MTPLKCLIIDEMFPNISELLEEAGLNPDYQPETTREDLISKIGSYEGLIVRSKTKIDQEVLQNANNLKFIARAGAGIDNIDEEACKKRNIVIFNAPEANRDAVGEHAVGMLLSIYSKINIADQEVRQAIWDREGNRGMEVQGKTVGIIGYGNMGSAFAKRLQGFGCRLIAYDKYKTGYEDGIVEEIDLDTLFEESDILSLHVPLTPDTKGMIDLQFLLKFRKKITLINTARGKVVVLRDLITALNTGKVNAAALDVLENEKIDRLSPEEQIDFNELSSKTNVLLTPHIAGWSYESYEKINEILVAKIADWILNKS